LIDWKLLDSSTDDEGVRLHWQLQLCDWQVDLHAHLGETLELRLCTEHQDELPCQLSHALHAYWRIGNVGEVALSGLEGAQGYDQLNRQVCQQEGELRWRAVASGCSSTRANCTSRTTPGSANCATPRQRRHGGVAPGSRPLLGVSFNEASGFVCVESAMAGASLAPGSGRI
jgi:D-hexose-6-phosphate mutarotase